MNRQRRKEIAELMAKLAIIREEVEIILNAEQDYYDNMPENLKGGEKGEKAEAATSDLESAYDLLEESIDSLNESMGEGL